ncbi:MAG: DASS family sodium-coupled anion symporter [Pirellulales bacterium]
MDERAAATPPADEPRLATRVFGLPLDTIGLVAGPLVLIVWLLNEDPSLAADAVMRYRLGGVMLLTILWWLTEPIPIPVTGLLAVVLAVVLGVIPADESQSASAAFKAVFAPFADPTVFFLMGGMFIGQAMMRHGLDRRFALAILCSRWAGRSPATVLGGVGLAVGLVSMFVSNTAATAMVFPVTMGLIAVMASGAQQSNGVTAGGFARSPYATALLLMTAYASSVGGIATPIGTTTNVVAMGYFKQEAYFGRSVDFLAWMQVGIPTMLLLGAALYLWLRLAAPVTAIDVAALRRYLHEARSGIGPWKRGEWNTLAVFMIVVSLWLAPGVIGLVDEDLARRFNRRLPEEIVALFIPVLLYLLPVNWRRREGTLETADLRRIDWGTLLLFGSGLALGGLMFRTGLASSIAKAAVAGLGTEDVWAITAVAIAAGVVLSEFTSNAATAATLIPVVWQICGQLEIEPLPPLMGLTFGASFGSALPVSTPPNAIVYGSGLIPMRRMIGAGVVFDVICIAVIWVALRLAVGLNWTPFLGIGDR